MTWLVILPLAAFFIACGRQEEKPAAVKAEKKLNIVATVAPITSIVAPNSPISRASDAEAGARLLMNRWTLQRKGSGLES